MLGNLWYEKGRMNWVDHWDILGRSAESCWTFMMSGCEILVFLSYSFSWIRKGARRRAKKNRR